MRLIYKKCSLVIVASWNRADFMPYWIAHNLQGSDFLPPTKPETPDIQNIDFNMRLGRDYSLLNTPVLINLNGFNLTFHERKAILQLCENKKDFQILQEFAIAISEKLEYTTITSYGINFLFEDEIGNIGTTNAIRSKGMCINRYYEKEINLETYITNTVIDEINTQIKFVVDMKMGKYYADINFHIDTNSMEEFRNSMKKYHINSMKDKSIDILQSIYEIQIDKNIDEDT